ncbi:MAG: 6,7-dimethyl-8-ribityllumazine synthase [Pseudomonadota bacterium]
MASNMSDHGALAPPVLTPGPRVLIVAAPFYRAITDGLIAGARAKLDAAGAQSEVIEAPGALELAPTIRMAAESGAYEGYVALGCVIRGETTHYETVCEESARGVTYLTVKRGLAIGNGVLTVETEEQALARALPERMDKGGGAALACLHLISFARRFRPPRGAVGRPSDDGILLA